MVEQQDNKRLVHITTIPLSLLVLINGQINYMKTHGFDVHGIASPGNLVDELVETYDIPFHGIPMTRRISPFEDIVSLFRLIFKLWELKPRIVHSHTPKGGLLGQVAAWIIGVPIRIFHLHGLRYATASGFTRQLLMMSDRLACALAHQVVIVSHSARETAIADKICSEEKSIVLLNGSINGVDAVNRFNPALFPENMRQAIRQQYEIPTDALLIGSIGRVVRDKGIVELLDAWQQLRNEFPNLHWILIGPFEDEDPIPGETKAILQEDKRIHVTGYIDHQLMPNLLTAIDLIVFPSYREGFPVTLLESAAMALPIVTTNVTGCVDAVEDGISGRIISLKDTDALPGAIRLYLNTPDLRQSHGRAGRDRVLRDFQPEKIREALLQTYQRLMEEVIEQK